MKLHDQCYLCSKLHCKEQYFAITWFLSRQEVEGGKQTIKENENTCAERESLNICSKDSLRVTVLRSMKE